jgi:hypothetical protein
MFGIDPQQISWVVETLKWITRALEQLAAKAGVTLDPPPAPPGG